MLLSGEATGPSRIPLEDLRVMGRSKNKNYRSIYFRRPIPCFKSYPFNNTKVRQAFAWAVPVEKIGEVLFLFRFGKIGGMT